MTQFICNFCKKELSSKSSLNNHIKSANYCIKNRPKTEALDDLESQNRQMKKIVEKFVCFSCNKKYASKQNLSLHIKKCSKIASNQYEKIIKDLRLQLKTYEKTIKKLREKLENVALKIASRPISMTSTTNNIIINNLLPVTEKHLKDSVQYLNLDHVLQGPKGFAKYAINHALKDRIKCVDYSRRKVKFKDEKGKIIQDPEMSKLTSQLFSSIKDKNKILTREFTEEKIKEIGISNMLDIIGNLFVQETKVNSASKGGKSEFSMSFVKEVCNHTV